ncbi:MAG TPA: alpha/beta hydrolase [Caulobacteraceae bacterium]|nr:alpha/beta hydrolase [Caulobacteraceae bacterium]
MAGQRIEEGLFLEVRGEPQWVTIRGDDREAPAVLVVGGAGAALSRLAPLYAPWEAELVVVQWDQPGAGATFARNGEPAPYGFDRIAADGVAVAEAVSARLGGRPLVLMAVSGGTVSGLTMLRARPDLFAAYAGLGQITAWARQQGLSYALALERARAAADAAALAQLEAAGPPPWPDMAGDLVLSKYANGFTAREMAALGAVMAEVGDPPPGASWIAPDLDPVDPRERGAAAYRALRSELWAFDAADLGTGFEIPMLLIQGAEDAYTVTADVRAWFETIEAPWKRFVTVEGAGHGVSFLAEAVLEALRSLPFMGRERPRGGRGGEV